MERVSARVCASQHRAKWLHRAIVGGCVSRGFCKAASEAWWKARAPGGDGPVSTAPTDPVARRAHDRALLRFCRAAHDEPIPRTFQHRVDQILKAKRFNLFKNEQEAMDRPALWKVANQLPLEFSVVRRVLREVSKLMPGYQPSSAIQYGARAGAGMWACREVWPETFKTYHSFDALAKNVPYLRSMTQNLGVSVKHRSHLEIHDTEPQPLVICSYYLHEIALNKRGATAELLWSKTRKGGCLVLVAPGDEKGFALLKQARDVLVSRHSNCKAIAPCGHSKACPMEKGKGKKGRGLCYFSERVQRGPLPHRSPLRQIRNRFGDVVLENFSYCVLLKGDPPPAPVDHYARKTETEPATSTDQLESEGGEWSLEGKEEEEPVPLTEIDIDDDNQFANNDQYDNTRGDDLEGADNMEEESEWDDEQVGVELGDEWGSEEAKEEEGPKGPGESVADWVRPHETWPASVLSQDWNRVITSPLRRTKKVLIDLCTSEGTIERRVIGKSKQDYGYAHAKKVKWGDVWPWHAPPSNKAVRRNQFQYRKGFYKAEKIKKLEARKAKIEEKLREAEQEEELERLQANPPGLYDKFTLEEEGKDSGTDSDLDGEEKLHDTRAQ